jgi:tetratricopeptide (TPR) repeat protein
MQTSRGARWRSFAAALYAITTLVGSAAAAEPNDLDSLLNEARPLLEAGRSAEAYALLAVGESDYGGLPGYDYLYGMAALDTGRAADAVFALQRVVSAEPNFDGARMELGRAYFESGDYESARGQFAYLRDRNPPAATRVVIERYLAAIDAHVTLLRPRLVTSFEVGSGYDSNANGSTADKQFLGFNLDTRNVATASGFLDATLGADYVHPIGRDYAWIANARANERWNPEAHFVDQTLLSAAASLAARFGEWRTGLGLTGFWGALDGASQDWSGNAELQATRALGGHWEATGSVSYGPLRYLDQRLNILDVNRLLASTRFDRVGLPAGGALSLTLLAGKDDARHEGSPYGGSRYGARASFAWQAGARARALVDVGAMRSDYSGGGGFFGVERRDSQYSAVALLDVDDAPIAGWRLEPRLRYMKNDSNVTLYAFDRWEIGLFLHRNFR